MYYTLKKQENGTYLIKNKSDKPFAPRGSFSVQGEDVKYPKVVLDGKKITIVNDDEAQSAAEAAIQTKPTKESLLSEVSGATNVDELKEIMNKIITEVL